MVRGGCMLFSLVSSSAALGPAVLPQVLPPARPPTLQSSGLSSQLPSIRATAPFASSAESPAPRFGDQPLVASAGSLHPAKAEAQPKDLFSSSSPATAAGGAELSKSDAPSSSSSILSLSALLASVVAAAVVGTRRRKTSLPEGAAETEMGTRGLNGPKVAVAAFAGNFDGRAMQSELSAQGDGTEALPASGWGQSARLAVDRLRQSLPFGRKARITRAAEEDEEAKAVVKVEEKEGPIKKAATIFANLFCIWLTIAAITAIKYPPSFIWVKSSYFTGLLGLLMFSVGITTTIDDFKECLKRPGAVAINFFSCYGIMPVLAWVLAKMIGADGAILAGMVLVGSINGGQASNLCTLIAGGDVALSVLMTTSTTLGCIFMTPLICKLVLGTVVPVDAMGIVVSTFQVVLAPIFLGVGANTLVPKVCKAVAPFTPTIGVISTVLLVGASVAKCAAPIQNAGVPLQLACMALHLFGGLLGFQATKMCGYNEKTCRTVAIETAMKSSAFGFLLASLHFGVFNVRVPSAVSVVWMAIVGSILAVIWKNQPIKATA